MTTRRQFTHAAAGFAALGALSPSTARAQSLELVKIINGFPAGGTADATSRRVGEKLAGSSFTKNAAVVENKPGAGGRIAVEAVKNAAPDGATLLLTPYSCTLGYIHPATADKQLNRLNRLNRLKASHETVDFVS